MNGLLKIQREEVMQDVVDKLMNFGFTRTEAIVYITLLNQEKQMVISWLRN